MSRTIPLRDLALLTRPRIVAMVLLAMWVGALIAGGSASPGRMAQALAGTALVIVGAIALNQRLERRTDACMARTAPRPLPSGRLSPGQVTAFGLGSSAAGLTWLALLADGWLLGLAALSWAVYVLVYTPLKPRSLWQTPIGAVAGAMPVLLGTAAAGIPWSPWGLTLFGVVFVWQFPHAMAIAWLYRDQFRRAGLRLPTVVDPTGRWAGRVALAGALAMLPVSLAPAAWGPPVPGYAITAASAGVVYLAAAGWFAARVDDRSARCLLRVSIIILLALLGAFLGMRSFPGG
jgi:protoheme IX farnesyltransferase